MTTLRALLLLLSVATFAVAGAACDGPGQPIDTSGDDDDDGPIDATFTTGAFEAMAADDCGRAGCHVAGVPQGGLALPGSQGPSDPATAHAAILAGGVSGPAVDTSNAEASLLLQEGLGIGHGGGAIWSAGDHEYRTVLAWISSGALLN